MYNVFSRFVFQLSWAAVKALNRLVCLGVENLFAILQMMMIMMMMMMISVDKFSSLC